MANAGASHISMQFGIQGPSYTISTACASSAHAIGQAFWMVRNGAAEVAIGDKVEMTFRRLNSADGIQNYFWKAKPVRGTQTSTYLPGKEGA